METPAWDQQAWERLARAVVRRRQDELGWSQQDVIAAGDGKPSQKTLSQIENAGGTNYAPRTLSQLEDALRWARGSVAAILSGGEPTPTDSPEGRSGTPLSAHLAQLAGDDPGHLYAARNPHYSPAEIEIAIRAVQSWRARQDALVSGEQDERRRA